MDQRFGMQELYDLVIKANSAMNFGNRALEAGEPLFYLNTVQMSALSESVTPKIARGGKGNFPLVVWEDRSEVRFKMTAGLLTDRMFGLLTAANIFSVPANSTTYVQFSEEVTLDSNASADLLYAPTTDRKIFCFVFHNEIMQNKIQHTNLIGNKIYFNTEYANSTVKVDYYYIYGEPSTLYQINRQRFNGLFTLEAKIYWKGEMDGMNITNTLTMPKVRISSDMNFIFGAQSSPNVGTFELTALPEKNSYSDYSIMEIIQLNEDIK